jgi:hypothetical protein
VGSAAVAFVPQLQPPQLFSLFPSSHVLLFPSSPPMPSSSYLCLYILPLCSPFLVSLLSSCYPPLHKPLCVCACLPPNVTRTMTVTTSESRSEMEVGESIWLHQRLLHETHTHGSTDADI